MSIEYALLGFIAPQPIHGYEIYQQLRAPAGLWQVWRIKQSQLYALLNKLEDEELLAATLQPQAARPPRKVYALTDAGRRMYQAWLTSPVEHGRQMRLEFMTKLYFTLSAEDASANALIDAQREVCLIWLAQQKTKMAQSQEILPQEKLPKELFTFQKAVHAFRSSQIDSFIAWLDACRALLPHTLGHP